ncbi:MAG TPA: response regulator [Melioribacteraceae bacterium]|nr:response regulator [Melioribacteraceae bacterium]
MDLDKILIVEDEEDTRFILHRLLTKNGYEVKTAENGAKALEVLNNFKPKVVLADWTMPVMDGLQLCNLIKAKEEFKTVYFIVLTARASLKDRVAGLDVGADDFLVKPIENQELLARIRSGIRIFNLQNELKGIEHNKALVEMACTIGHRINNPLSSLKMSIETLHSDLSDNYKKKFEDDFEIISESIKRIEKFVNTLQHLENPELSEYASNRKMLKID